MLDKLQNIYCKNCVMDKNKCKVKDVLLTYGVIPLCSMGVISNVDEGSAKYSGE